MTGRWDDGAAAPLPPDPTPSMDPPADPDAAIGAFDATVAARTKEMKALLGAIRQETIGTPAQRAAWYQAIVDRLLEHNQCGEAVTRRGCSLEAAASFKRMLFQQTLREQLSGRSLAYVVNSKRTAGEIADALGIRRPGQSARMRARELLAFLEGQPGDVVVKPAGGAGSKGVFVVNTPTDIIDVVKAERLGSLEAMGRRIAELLERRLVRRDSWFVEERVGGRRGGPARDLKFYSFYGEVGLVLEIVRYPKIRHCWWSPKGTITTTGKYRKTAFKGKGFSQDERRAVEALSSRIPLPFMRIDFLRSRDGLVFGEFTPRPGEFHKFSADTDRALGLMFLRAEDRLLRDLLAGKRFPEYEAALSRSAPG